MAVSEKFEWVCNYYKRMAGDSYIGFNNATYLSEKEEADRNYAIAYYMKENKCFPQKSNLQDTLDFYFQVRCFTRRYNCLTTNYILLAVLVGSEL